MDLAGALKDNIKVFLPIVGLFVVIIAFYLIDLDSSSLTNLNSGPTEKRTEYKANVQTNLGNFTIDLYKDTAPKNVENFVTLSKDGFYNGLKFHRVIEGFIIQTGDPEGTGYGGAGYYVNDEIAKSLSFTDYTVAMANEGKANTNSSQFFITLKGGSFGHLDGNYTIIGKVVDGLSVVDRIGVVSVDSNNFPIADVVVESIEILQDSK